MPRAELPGFYFDEERGRYFKVVQTGLATNEGSSNYSVAAINESQRQKIRIDHQKITERVQPTGEPELAPRRHWRARASGHVLSKPTETVLRQPLARQGSASAGGLKRRVMMPCKLPRDDGSMPIYADWRSSSDGDEIVYGNGRSLFMGPLDSFEDLFESEEINGEVVSVSCAENVVSVVSTDGKSWKVETHIDDVDDTTRLFIENLPGSASPWIVHTESTEQYVWNASGGCGRIVVVILDEKDSTPHHVALPAKSTILSIKLLQQRRTVAAGCRNGMIAFADYARVDTPDQLIWAPSSVTNIEVVEDDRYILASGLEDVLALYDRRFLKPAGASYKLPFPSYRQKPNWKSLTRPVIAYPGYSNLATLNHGMSVLESSGSVDSFAVADGNGKVKLYDVWSGSDITGNDLDAHTFQGVPRNLKWNNHSLKVLSEDEVYVVHEPRLGFF